MNLTCQKCGSIDDFRTVQAGPHQSAYCNGCDNFIKHLPQNNPIEILPFGKYKGRTIKSLTSAEDVRYLYWLIEMPNMKNRLKDAIVEHLKSM